MSYVKKTIFELKKHFGVNSDTDLAEMLGITQGAVAQWKARDEIPIKYIKKFASIIDAENFEIPFFPQAKASCANGSVAVNDEVSAKTLKIPTNYLKNVLGVGASSIWAMIAEGDSMSPTIGSGDILFIEPCGDELRDGGVYIFTLEGETYCKRIFKDLETGGLIIKSDNINAPTIHLTKERAKLINFGGRVVRSLAVKDL